MCPVWKVGVTGVLIGLKIQRTWFDSKTSQLIGMSPNGMALRLGRRDKASSTLVCSILCWLQTAQTDKLIDRSKGKTNSEC